MDIKEMQNVIHQLFSASAALGKYKQQYTAEMIDIFLMDNAGSLSEKIIAIIGKDFEAYVAIVNSKMQPVDASINVESDELCTQGLSNVSHDEKSSEENQQLSENIASESPLIEATYQESEPMKVTELPSIDSGAMPIQLQKLEPQNKPNQQLASGDNMPRKFSFKLKGGKLQAGVLYDGRLEYSEGSPGIAPSILTVEMTPDIGLKFDKDDPARIYGTPTIGGEITLSIKFNLGASEASAIELTSNIDEFVNHDPKTLWKDLPSDREDPHWKSDYDSILLEAGDRKLVAASQRGRSHAHEGKFRDDDFLMQISDTGWHVIAVADGAGSAIKSRRGSQIAVSTAVNVLLELLAGEDGARLEKSVSDWHKGDVSKEQVVAGGVYPVLGIAAFKACKAIEEEANGLGVAVKEFSTTLLVTVFKKMSFGNLFATYWVGDGGVGICLNDGTPKLLGKVDSGEYAGQTRFLDYKVMTTEEITARLHFEVVDEFRALVAMTDGITDPWFMTDNNLESQEYWGKLWTEVEPALKSDDPAASLLAWLDFWSPGNHDDRTIAILW
ncbi:MAG TPA: PP2C family serine/threonine-protein phosphatase [Arenimonas sp.]|nr:PP2C family serine/threonine-protein phosphatase [Arenimonas sp.]